MQAYFELRKASDSGADNVAADIMRHLYTRQYLGKSVVVCSQPVGLISAARKQWLKLSRSLQRQRAGTLNADKILKFTHGIVHMQRLRFTAKALLQHPEADIFFLQPDAVQQLPAQCLTAYLTQSLTAAQTRLLRDQLPPDALVIDYTHDTDWAKAGLAPKSALEARVDEAWKQVKQFLRQYNIAIEQLQPIKPGSVEAVDDALDTLLGVSHRFLGVAAEFQRALELARPMRTSKPLRETYDTFILLAHRVQALTPGAFSRQFLQIYNEDDTFFLFDQNRELLLAYGESLEESHARHLLAGRKHLARALALHLYQGRSFQPAV
ncbi:MAG: hypothetical protein ACREGD_01040 [Candidatus Saccharimonadales bacterium]